VMLPKIKNNTIIPHENRNSLLLLNSPFKTDVLHLKTKSN